MPNTSKQSSGNLVIGYYDVKGNHVRANYQGQTDAQAATLIAAAFAVSGALINFIEFKSY
jgi:hypothetical protein